MNVVIHNSLESPAQTAGYQGIFDVKVGILKIQMNMPALELEITNTLLPTNFPLIKVFSVSTFRIYCTVIFEVTKCVRFDLMEKKLNL